LKVFRSLTITFFAVGVILAQTRGVSVDNTRLGPRLLNYQACLTDTLGVPINDSLDMTFKIFDAASSGSELWSETQTNVPIESGVFSVMLGEVTPIPDSVFAGFSNTWLELILEGPQTLTPRTRITSVGYAYTSTYSDTSEYVRIGLPDSDWVYNNNRLYPAGDYGLAMRSGNVMWGTNLNTHVNFGVSCTTGTLLQNYNYCTVSGGYRNRATYSSATIAGGWQNIAAHHYAAVGGGSYNYNGGYYSVIPGGYADTIAASGGYSYLFGINSNLTQDSTFMVDLPHIKFGDESSGYEFPDQDGSNGQMILTNSSGQLSWTSISSLGNWPKIDSVLYTKKYWGIARGGADNVLYGDSAHTHINLGVACTTGLSGYNIRYCTASGGYRNSVSAYGATVRGGYWNLAVGNYAFVGGGFADSAGHNYATVGGGNFNCARQQYATVGGGQDNDAREDYTVVGGGEDNRASAQCAAVGGGQYNIADDHCAIGGGFSKGASGFCAAAVGGYASSATDYFAAIGGGLFNHASYDYSIVGGGYNNAGLFDYSTITSGYADTGWAMYGGIVSGWHNTVGDLFSDTAAFVGGGYGNAAFAPYADVSSGYADTARAVYSGIVSGWHNIAGDASTDTAAFIGGGKVNAALAQYATVCGGYAATIQGVYGGIASGCGNLVGDEAADTAASMAGGWSNVAAAKYSFVGGGRDNHADSAYVMVGYGYHNTASHEYATVISGLNNRTYARYATVGGGTNNRANAQYTTVNSGDQNTASGDYATIAGGYADTVAAYAGFSTNYSTKVNASDTNSAAFTTSHTIAPNQVRAAAFSTGSLVFSMDHPIDPLEKVLNQYAVGSSEPVLLYNGNAFIEENGRVEVFLPDYFDKINKNPRIQLTGVGSSDIVYVVEEVKGNSFIIGGKPGMKVYWTVTAERKDAHAEIARIQTPIEQLKTDDLIGHSLDHNASIGLSEYLLLREE
jgi:hypothetical protein